MDKQTAFLFIDGHLIRVEIDPYAKWIETKHPEPCPDCEAIRREAFISDFLRRLRIAGRQAYEDGRADSGTDPT